MRSEDDYTFTNKVLIASAIIAFFIVILILLKAVFNVILLILTGVLIATYFRGLSYWLSDKFKLKDWLALMIVVSGTLILAGLLIWMVGSKVSGQFTELGNRLPHSMEEFKNMLSQYEWGRTALEHSSMFKSGNSGQKIVQTLRSFFKTTFGVLGDIYVIIFIGLFFTAQPAMYKNAILAIVPPSGRKKADEIAVKIGFTLRSWLAGKVFAMIVVAILTATGLFILGIPMALALAVIAGALNFIPNFGPVISMIPAVLVALSESPHKALLVAGLYVLIQVVESNFITPFVQRKLIEIPPAFIIITQVAMGTLTGALGIILATPIIAILMVLINALYIKHIDAESTEDR